MNAPTPVYGAVPPPAVTVTVVVPPLQLIVPELLLATNTAGSVIDTDPTAVQPLLSVTVTVYVPAAIPLISEVVEPVDHA